MSNLPVKQEMENHTLTIFGKENFPVVMQEGIDEILDIVVHNKTLPQLYEKELKETMVSTSIFQDICVQMEEHHTPHRKLRQVMLELGNKLDSLDAAKNGHKKNIVKLQTLKDEVDDLQEIYDKLSNTSQNPPEIDFNLALRLSTISYLTKNGMDDYQSNKVLPDGILQITSTGKVIKNSEFIKTIKDKVKIALANKIVDYEESERGLESSKHMIKDAAVKAYQLRKQAEKYRAEVEESGLTFDESEIIYYVIYFTAESERQLRTGDHQIDRGTYKAISQLPDFIRIKVLKNIDYISKKLLKNYEQTDSWWATYYIFLNERHILDPKFERDENGDLIIEGIKIKDYLMMEIIKTMDNE
jgi:hypothetical protein